MIVILYFLLGIFYVLVCIHFRSGRINIVSTVKNFVIQLKEYMLDWPVFEASFLKYKSLSFHRNIILQVISTLTDFSRTKSSTAPLLTRWCSLGQLCVISSGFVVKEKIHLLQESVTPLLINTKWMKDTPDNILFYRNRQ